MNDIQIYSSDILNDKDKLKIELSSSLLKFTQTFYKLRTNRDFLLSYPVCRESHFITIAKALTDVFLGKTKRLIINIPPRYGKTELVINFIAWALARFPDSNFMYVSYSHTLSRLQTQAIRETIRLPMYKKIFDTDIDTESAAKDDFMTTHGGSVYATGAGGTIVGRGAGIRGVSRFGGAIVIDDIHKPDEAASDLVRLGVIDWYYNTLQTRLNSFETPIILIGQRVHEDDLSAHLIQSAEWTKVVLPALDEVGNALYPELHDAETLKKMQEIRPYEFAAQMQQNPQPAGGGLFKKAWFEYNQQKDVKYLCTFITADTAETSKTHNDPTVFSFWSVYKIESAGQQTGQLGLDWLDCIQIWVEPKDLQNEFMNFYAKCMRNEVKPSLSAIEKKSTGSTLISVLKTIKGMNVVEIERSKSSGSKTDRFISIQSYIAQKLVTFPLNSPHFDMCVEHMSRITANNSHKNDDICDTVFDAIKIALIDKSINGFFIDNRNNNSIIERKVNERFNKLRRLYSKQIWN